MNISMNQFNNNNKNQRKYNLQERTAIFGEDIISFCKTLIQDSITKSLINQLIRSSTSIGANYMEANSACSKKDFQNKIFLCKKEAEETKHWLRMLAKALPNKKEEIKKLWVEVQELTMIFQKIINSLRKNKNN